MITEKFRKALSDYLELVGKQNSGKGFETHGFFSISPYDHDGHDGHTTSINVTCSSLNREKGYVSNSFPLEDVGYKSHKRCMRDAKEFLKEKGFKEFPGSGP